MKFTRKLLLLFLVLILGLGTVSVHADDGGGGAGTGGGGDASGDAASGNAWVWFDKGGWAASGNKDPEQGAYWRGMTAAQEQAWLNKCYSKFMTLLDQKIYLPGPREYGNAAERQAGLKAAMKQACEKAITRGGDPTQKARVVGVAITWGEYAGTWGVSTHWLNPNSFQNLFGNHAATTSELSDAYGWGDKVNQTKHSDALANEKWRDYIYRIGGIDNPGDGSLWQVYVVAVTDNMPEPASGKGKIVKTY